MAKTTPKTRSKRAKTPKRPRAKTLGGGVPRRLTRRRSPPGRVATEVDADLVPAVRWLLELLAMDAGSQRVDVHRAIVRVQELLP